MIEVVRERTVTAVSADRVWDLVEPVAQLPQWLSMSETSELLAGQGLGRRQRLQGHWGNHRFEIDQTVTIYEPKRVLGWKHDAERLDGKPAPRLSAATTFRIELQAINQDVLIRLRSRHVPENWFKGIVVRMVAAPRVARILDDSLNRLAEKLARP